MAQIEVKVKLDLPAGVELLGYERCGEGHGFEVKFPLPLYCRCEKCGTKEPSKYEYKNTVYAVREKFQPPGARLEVDLAAGLPKISGDADALTTVLVDLLDNAHKYTGDDKHVILRAHPDGGKVRFEVQDNGVGLSRRAARKVFDRFYQVDQSLSRRAGGCGLGLSIVRFIVAAHGGSVSVSSQPGRGSTFTVSLAAAERSAAGGDQTTR